MDGHDRTATPNNHDSVSSPDRPDIGTDAGEPDIYAPRVLLVDGHAPLRRQLRALLQGSGMLVIAEAGDGTTALEAARLTGPDVVLMDIRMPGMDGLEATRQLTREHPGLPVVINSADDSPAVVDLAHQAGATTVIHKGDPPGALVEALHHAATQGRQS